MGALDLSDEARRRKKTLLGVAPADQRLDARDRTGGKVDLGLIVENELLALDTVAQIEQQSQAIRGLGFLDGAEDGWPSPDRLAAYIARSAR